MSRIEEIRQRTDLLDALAVSRAREEKKDARIEAALVQLQTLALTGLLGDDSTAVAEVVWLLREEGAP